MTFLEDNLQNLSDNCNKGGLFIGTCYDGSRIFELLKDKNEFSMNDIHENIVFSIKEDYELDNFNYDKIKYKNLIWSRNYSSNR